MTSYNDNALPMPPSDHTTLWFGAPDTSSFQDELRPQADPIIEAAPPEIVGWDLTIPSGMPDPAELRRQRRIRLLCVLLGALLMTASSAFADTSPRAISSAPSASAPAPAQPTDFAAQVAAQIAPRIPAEMRLEGVALGCNPPADAILKSVAPGLNHIESRGFVVEFQLKDRTLACSASLSAVRQVLFATHDIESNQPLSDQNFEVRETDAFAGPMGALSSLPQNGPYASATRIRAGQPLYPNEIARPAAVHPGDLVATLVKNGPVTVRAQLVSQSTAAVGETATMTNPTSGSPVTVTVTGPKTAEVVMQ